MKLCQYSIFANYECLSYCYNYKKLKHTNCVHQYIRKYKKIIWKNNTPICYTIMTLLATQLVVSPHNLRNCTHFFNRKNNHSFELRGFPCQHILLVQFVSPYLLLCSTSFFTSTTFLLHYCKHFWSISGSMDGIRKPWSERNIDTKINLFLLTKSDKKNQSCLRLWRKNSL